MRKDSTVACPPMAVGRLLRLPGVSDRRVLTMELQVLGA
jgi:hypothetical protein